MHHNVFNVKSFAIQASLLLVLLLITCVFCLQIGTVKISPNDIVNVLLNKSSNELYYNILVNIRVPRVLYAVAIGGGLSVAGAIFQGILINPLAEPYILGVSGGAAFGAVIAITLNLGIFLSQVFSLTGSVIVIGIVFLLAKKLGDFEPQTLLLIGVMIASFFSALILIVITLSNETARTALFWIVGNLSLADSSISLYILIFSIMVSLILSSFGYKLNVLSLGEEHAKYLGLNTKFVKNTLLFLTTGLVSVLVSVSGLIGFVGLVVPHVTRLIFGVDNRKILPFSFFIGAIYLTLTDTLARTVIAPAELPVGAITAILGSPIFIFFLKRKR